MPYSAVGFKIANTATQSDNTERSILNLGNGNINKLKQDYGLNDLVDLLAMTAFEFANQSLDQNQPSHAITTEDKLVEKKLSDLKLQIEEILTLG